MSNSIAPGSSADVNVRVTALTTNPNVPVTYKTIILKKNLVNGVNTFTQEMMSTTNTKYVIKYDYVLGEDITVPENCILEFDGGSISGGTIEGNNTKIIAEDNEIFTNIHIEGTWNLPQIRSYWFSDITSVNKIRELINLSSDTLFNEIYIAPGTYILYADPDEIEESLLSDFRYPHIISLKSNTKIIIDGDIYLNATNLDGYYMFALYHVSNVEICGSGSIQGDKFIHTGSTGESGHGIWMKQASHISIHDVFINACWGDCICIGGGNLSVEEDITKFVILKNLNLKDGRRQGISVIHADTVKIENCNIYDIGGTNPQAGIDLEPNPDITINRNISIKNCIIERCSIGILIYGRKYKSGNSGPSIPDITKNQNIYIENCLIKNGNGNAIRIDGAYEVNVSNCQVQNKINSKVSCLYLDNNNFTVFDNCIFDTLKYNYIDEELIQPLKLKGYNGLFRKCRLIIGSGISAECNYKILDCSFEGADNTATIDFKNDSDNLFVKNMFCIYRGLHKGLNVEIDNGNTNKSVLQLINAFIISATIQNYATDFACYNYMAIRGSKVYGLDVVNNANSKKIERLADIKTWNGSPSCLVGVFFKDGINITKNIINTNGDAFAFVDIDNLIIGTTSQRPSWVKKGFAYYDTDIRKILFAESVNGNTGEVNIWREADGVRADTPRIGNSSHRPNGQYNRIAPGFMYFDTEINKLIIAKTIDATTSPYTVIWVDATGTPV